ncbi:MAG: energy transducer TonB [Bacteroidetes bacterium]|jgi:TonB family protein|nr:energy transducer TonB [Bacteroidota bacterium]
MILSREEENKNRIISAMISLAIFILLLLFLIFYIVVTPNPPFPVSEGGGGGIEFNIGNLIEGTGNVENNGIGDAVQVVESTEVTPPSNQENSAQDLVTSDQGEDIDIKKSETNNTNTSQTVVIPVKPKVKTTAEILAEKFNKNKGNKGGGDGNSGHEGNDGRPDGNPNTNGQGGTGGGEGGGDGPGKGPGKGPGNGGYGFSLAGRAVVSPPPLSKDTKEEGKVVVEITVDKNGKVIKADPNGRGTTTSSPMLKAKARQAALATTFNVSGEFEEQKGTITIIFSF